MTELQAQNKRISRRNFLIAAGLGGAGVVILGVNVGVPFARLKLAEFLDGLGGTPGGMKAEASAWFLINADNSVVIYMPKMEMGQGVHTALAQIAADELDIAWEQVDVRYAATGQGLDDNFGTGGSTTVSSLYQPLREAGAVMREVLLVEAARQLGVDRSAVSAAGGVITAASDGQQLTYGEVVAAASGEWELPDEIPPLKSRSDFQHIGQPYKRVDIESKITGEAVFGYDARMPGMLYGAVLRPTKIGAKLASVSVGDAEGVDGVVSVVIDGDFAGVVAETRSQAYAGVQALDVEWQTDREWQQDDIDALVTVGQGKDVVIQREGNAARELRNGSDVLEVEYRTPMAYHAHLEPQGALADVTPSGVTVWVSTQGPVGLKGTVAKALGRDEEQVTIMPAYLGGGFGRKISTEAAVEAARLSAAVGKPVHVGWMRPEEFRNGFMRPPTHHVLKGLLDNSGKILAAEHQQASGEVAFPFVPGFLKTVMGADFGSWRGAFIHYDIPHRRTVAWLADLPVSTGWWRGLGLMANTFAIESFIDEMAAAVGADPLQFRLDHLPGDAQGQRYRRVLEAVRDQSGWGSTLPAGHGRGVAVSIDVGTIVAEVAEVSVADGDIRVHKITAAVDMGLVINPDGAAAQVEGAITMGLSSTLREEARVLDGELEASNFNRYPLLTMRDAPDIDVVLLEGGDEPLGLGEPPIGPVAAAVANAVYAASGKRLRELPLKLT